MASGGGRAGRAIGALALLASLALPAAAAAQQQAPGGPATGPLALESDKCADTRYPDCKRLRYVVGPLTITPGANYQLVGQSIGKPSYDGYVLRMDANMVRPDGSVPPVDVLHLHHAVWLSVPQYGNFLPFYGVGEEKTVMSSPGGYGMAVRGRDVWVLNHMLHNLTTTTEPVYITYDIDYVPKAEAEAGGIKPVKPLWIDVRYHDRPYYPVFNVQRGFGKLNKATGKSECVYPRDTCAAFDPFGKEQPGNGKGYDWTVPEQFAGTLVGMGGHVHPGGLRDEVSLVRKVGGTDVERRIFNSEAVYFDPGGPISWDVAMTVTKPNWRVRIEPGDRIRLNAVYDAERASWYEGMGIVMAFVSPGEKAGVDPFRKVKVRVRAKGRRRGKSRKPRYRYVRRYVRFSLKGETTHGHLAENDNHGGLSFRPLPAKDGPVVQDVGIGNFTYYPGDLARVDVDGIPRVKFDDKVSFHNFDAAAGIWHTVTTCEEPCTGTTGISYPLADATPPLDSLELGRSFMPGIQPTAEKESYTVRPKDAGLKQGRTYTYFCRIHPFMRGAFKVE